jgi:signal transduction histidine kinase
MNFESVIYIAIALLVGVGFGCVLGLKINRRSSGEELGSILIRSETPEFLLLRYSKTGALSFVSRGIHALLGIPGGEFINGKSSLRDFVHESDMPLLVKAEELRSELRNEVLQFQYRLRRPDGRWHWMHERQEPVLNRGGRVIAYESLLIDFSDRLRFEEKQRRLLDIQRMITSAIDAFGDSDSLSDEASSCLEYVSHYLRLNTAMLLKINTLEDDKKILSAVGNPGDMAPPIPIEGVDAQWWIDKLCVGEPLEIDSRNIEDIPLSQRGGYQRCVSGSILVFPITTDDGLSHVFVLESKDPKRRWEPEEVSGICSAAEAVSRRIEQLITQREREQFSEKRANIERSESISHFISGIIHDFNNLIFAVSGKLSLMIRKSSDPQEEKSLEEIRGLVSDAGRILQRLLRAGRLGLDDVTRIDPWSEMSQIMRTAQRLLPRRISFEYALQEPALDYALIIEAVPQTLQQLVLNLVVNARDAIGDDGRIRVEAGATDDQNWFVITVHDDGPGIPNELRDEAMKPYSSTKKNGSGIGLGLSICRRVVSDAKGKFELGVSPLGGLMATAKFPLHDGVRVKPAERVAVNHSISGTVVLIEDNPQIRSVLERELELAGATVVSRPDALDCEQVMNANSGEIVLMVFDIDLPRRTGIECLTSLRASGNQIPCLLITGGPTQPPEIARTGFLRKPFTTERMFESITALMNEDESQE